MEAQGERDWRKEIQLSVDPYSASEDRWVAELPPNVDWRNLDDRLIARGLYPKNAAAPLRVYGADGGHEIVIEPGSRRVVFRISARTADAKERETCAEKLARLLADEMAS